MVQLGQSMNEVMSLMGKGPERREAQPGSETWWFLTQYQARMHTLVIFKDGVVAEIRQSR